VAAAAEGRALVAAAAAAGGPTGLPAGVTVGVYEGEDAMASVLARDSCVLTAQNLLQRTR